MKYLKRLLSGRRPVFISAILICTFILCGCSVRNSSKSYNTDESYILKSEAFDGFYSANDDYTDVVDIAYEKDSYITDSEFTATSQDSSNIAPDSERKIIRNASLSLETKSFDQSVASVSSIAEQFGGYVENSYVNGQSLDSSEIRRRANFTVRVPAEKLDDYLNSIGGSFNVLSKSITSDDISSTYYDIEARLSSLELQEERLLAMLEKATELEYLIQLEQALSDVRYQIESYYSQIRRYDSQVSYSTVTMNITEVIEYQKIVEAPKTFGDRFTSAMSNSWANFVDSLENFVINFIYILPALIIWIIIIALAVIIIRRYIIKMKKKKASLYQAQFEKYNTVANEKSDDDKQ